MKETKSEKAARRLEEAEEDRRERKAEEKAEDKAAAAMVGRMIPTSPDFALPVKIGTFVVEGHTEVREYTVDADGNVVLGAKLR